MSAVSIFQLFLLAAIWGGSFLFMRMGAPVLGATWLVELRVGLAALFLTLVAVLLKKTVSSKGLKRHFMMLGFFNSVLPFMLFGYAAHTLSASLLSILNATAPIWGALITAVWYKEAITPKAILGMLLGICGVAILVGFDPVLLQPGSGLAIVAAVMAAACYGIASTYARGAVSVEPFNNAYGSMWAATLILLPLLPFDPPQQVPDISVSLAVLTLGVVCSGMAYLLFFRLISDIGASSTLTVTFLIPMFGVLWGHIVLDEQVGWHTLAGSVIVITGTILVTGFSVSHLFQRRNAG